MSAGRRSHNLRTPGEQFHVDWDAIFRDILRSWWLVILSSLTAGLLAAALMMIFYTPRYSCTSTFVIGSSGFSYRQIYNNLEQAKTTTSQYTQVVSSSILEKRVCEELGLSSFDANVSVNTLESTNLMTLTVTSGSPRMAFLINHSVRKNARELLDTFTNGITMIELDPAAIPTRPSNPLSIWPEIRIYMIISALAMLLILGLISQMKDTVKNAQDVNRKVDAQLLGVIFHERPRLRLRMLFRHRNKHHSLLLNNPMLSFGFVEAYRMVAARVRIALDNSGKKVLMVTSVTENEGKSTVSANLAIALAQSGKNVLLMDCDFRNPSQKEILGCEVPEEQDLTRMVQKQTAGKAGRLKKEQSLITLLSDTPRRDPWSKESMDFLSKMIHQAKERMDYVIIDTSPMAFVSDAEEYASIADASLLVIKQDVMEASYINDAVDALEEAGSEMIGCVLNDVRRGVVGHAREYGRYSGSNYSHYSHYRREEARKEEQDG